MPSQKEIREDITRRIVTAMESGVMPWRRPWRVSPNAGRPPTSSASSPTPE